MRSPRRLNSLLHTTVRRSPVASHLIAILSRITWRARFERVLEKQVRVHGAGRTDAGVHALAQCAHIDLPNDRLSAARWDRSAQMHCCLQPFAFFGCHMCRMIFTRDFRQKEKFIVTELVAPFCSIRISSCLADRATAQSQGSKRAAKHSSVPMILPGSLRIAANQKKARPLQLFGACQAKSPCLTIEFDGDGFLYKMVR